MSKPEELRGRVDALEFEVANLQRATADLPRLREGVGAAQVLARWADRDAAEVRHILRTQVKVLSALRQTQVEQGDKIDRLAAAVGTLIVGQQRHDDAIATLIVGQQRHDDLLTEHGGRLDTIDARLTEHDHRFDTIDARLTEHDHRFDTIDARLTDHGEALAGITQMLRQLVGRS